MPNSQITFRGIYPIHSPLNLQLGVDQFSKPFISALKSIESTYVVGSNDAKNPLTWRGQLTDLGGEKKEQRQYSSAEDNSKDIRLLCWSPLDNPNVMFHVFSNNIAIAEIELTLDTTDIVGSADNQVKIIEKRVQTSAHEKITSYYADFIQDLKQLNLYLSSDFTFTEENSEERGDWVSRTMLLTDEFLAQENTPQLLKAWLKNTIEPLDADNIISGDQKYSMTWLNYAIKDAEAVGQDPLMKMMILAQYYYVAQENNNSDLRGAIESAYTREKTQKSNAALAHTRTACRLNQIAFYENIKFLSIPNRELLVGILKGWSFNELVENSERMIEICNVRLQEEDNKKRERSTVMTDFLLVALSFFTVFELSLYLTEFSREMMSRPALDYNDNKSSFFLSFIAEIDSDIMFSFGFGLTLLLIVVYRYIKRN